ncbi:MAG: hypothetical protein H0S85_00770 [Desulfovibrionaceae bacterium]|jgi:major membrane immunogen (membrane-anchored lipoprotein)|nr:hypothetical protein [Desulfovibrionaceae bacterium]
MTHLRTFLFRPATGLIAAVLISALCAAPALAGGSLSKTCGSTLPEGSYRSNCNRLVWRTSDTFTANCKKDGGLMTAANISCEKIKDCNWKLRNDNGALKCED